MPYYFYDATYILVLIGALISMFASWNVQNTFRTYSRVWNSRNIPAQDIAQMILHDAGIYDVRIERIRGDLTDHYSPNEKILRLSDSVYGSTSVAAIGVAAHECGHAIQHQEGYAPLKLRSFSVPLANIGSRLSWPIIVLGLILGWSGLLEIGILLFVFVVAFQLITLPVEIDASHRAIRILEAKQLFGDQELQGAKRLSRFVHSSVPRRLRLRGSERDLFQLEFSAIIGCGTFELGKESLPCITAYVCQCRKSPISTARQPPGSRRTRAPARPADAAPSTTATACSIR